MSRPMTSRSLCATWQAVCRCWRKKYKSKLDAKADQILWHAVESVTRMKALIMDLLAYSRLGTRGNPFQPTNCEEVLEQTLANLRPTIEETGALITYDPLPTVTGDFTQLLQVFQNLIGNAMKFRRQTPPEVHVSAARVGMSGYFRSRTMVSGLNHSIWTEFSSSSSAYTKGLNMMAQAWVWLLSRKQ